MYASINGAKIYFDVEGSGLVAQGDRLIEKPVVLVLPGSFLDHSCFKPALSPLADHCQLIYMDYRGYARSGVCEPSGWHLEQLASDVLALLDYLGIESAYLLGHSYGCHVAARCASGITAGGVQHKISGLILLNPFLIRDPDRMMEKIEATVGIGPAKVAKAIFFDRDPAFIEDFMREVSPHYFVSPPSQELFARVQANFEFVFATMDELFNVSIADCLTQTALKVMACHGVSDLYFDAEALDTLAQTLGAGAPTHCFDKAGHFVYLDQPGLTIEAIVDFITPLGASANGSPDLN